ncbi:MAG: aspartate aminotransferase [Candidatus Kerfeldbacteria bacterium RIFOXYA2_FULL_38_24]|uniref:Aspartate aminotransferase n=1 Tax=Candidatus Kerfeldbacteria bacterium RIFOXYB2_FULL_38_14 TaxID=1798547 RepID=A0A1G2BGZ4_9BACT|nr:MAG: aspartate aminotransferase [Candidatus Kerfeldbacteria bacterium RIFOXYA2_FULL_38_24]OGY88335.1 MAG: aspartate aminotransferase [Candidatus Kerfeldbacteria bacterium RIFOXYB2_FULL_38_14]
MNPQAKILNDLIAKQSPVLFSLLSQKGKEIFFPKKGILAQSADAKGKKINATIGTAIEDDGSPMRLESISKNTTLPPQQVFPYAPSFGTTELRQVWQKAIFQKNPSLLNKNISLPVATQALTHGLSIVGYLFVDAQDEILLPDYFWGNYNLIFNNAYGAILETYPTFEGNFLNLSGLEQGLKKGKIGKKIILLNFPNNPTGYTPTIKEVKKIVKIIKNSAKQGNRLVIIIDDAYFGLVYEKGIEKESIFARLANLHENVLAIKIDGPTKEDYVWGLRVGFITFGIKNGQRELYETLEQKTAGVIRGSVSNISNLSQSLLLNAYQSPSYEEEKAKKYQLLKKRYQTVKKVLQNEKYQEYFDALPFNSGYFMCIKLKNNLDGEAVRQLLLKEYDTGIIDLAGVLRIAFSAVKENDILPLFENIYNACKKLNN